jgi:hypothetical protein
MLLLERADDSSAAAQKPLTAPYRCLAQLVGERCDRGAMVRHVFSAPLWEHSPGDPGSWHFVTLPEELSEDVVLEAGPRGGFGSVRVEARIGSTTWHTSLFPDSTIGSFLLPVKKSVREAEGLSAGDVCEVTLGVVTGH